MQEIPRLRALALAAALSLAGGASAAAQGRSVFRHFITASGAHLMDGAAPFRFISFNIPNLNFVEDELAFTRPHEYRLPDEYELRDAFESVRQLGGTVVRLYTFPVRTEGDPPDLPRYVLAPGRFDEASFRVMDLVLALANEYGIRLIVPLINNWQWMGGRPQYAAFRGKASDTFWSDPQLIADFERTVAYVLNRTNTVTGVRYRDDPAILCWETGNELQAPQSWTDTIARFIKSIDRRHLVLDGFGAGGDRLVSERSLENPDIDIVSTHHYEQDPGEVLAHIEANRALIRGRKPYVVGEIGFFGTPAMRRIFDRVIAEGDISGALVWSLRYHRREGGFYWHSEPAGLAVFKAYHSPGFASGDAYDERGLLALMRAAAHRIRGLPEPPWPVPAEPILLPITDVSAISWRGSAGAASYDVQRAQSADGPWRTVGLGISDADAPYFPLFDDATAATGDRYYYRVVARNESGPSAPSNVVGPVSVTARTWVDDMRSLTRAYRATGKLSVATGEDRRFREALHRVRGEAGSELTYAVPGPIAGIAIYSFARSDSGALSISLSEDGSAFHAVAVGRTAVPTAAGAYGYLVPVLYRQSWSGGRARFVRIHFDAPAQIARVEVRYRAQADGRTAAELDARAAADARAVARPTDPARRRARRHSRRLS